MRKLVFSILCVVLTLALLLPAAAQEDTGGQFRGQVIAPTPQPPCTPPAEVTPQSLPKEASAPSRPAKASVPSRTTKTKPAPARTSKSKATASKTKASRPTAASVRKAPSPKASRQKSTAPRPVPSAAGAAPLRLQAKAAYLMDMDSGEIYFAQDADRLIPPASVTKVMTLYLIREAIAQGKLSVSAEIPVSARAARVGGSSMHLVPGERAPLLEIIKGISVASANNACVAVAEYLSKGNTAAFVARMNAKARELGMRRTVFKNPSGLPAPGQMTTARDLAVLARAYLHRFPESLAIHSMTTHTYRGVTHHNANSLLETYPGADGLKTGFVCASGFNIVATAKRGKTRLLAVVLGATSSGVRHRETVKLLDYGFARAAGRAS
ncbi:serine hydrolase [Thermodesulfomicrobium sp. WS]|uniref:D-alanyl-D-alanine carboxypeptidase family protein n=1 Tax=Thermodesulfomicrobium sp. WS TaxID=3004129 RepID=UPI00249068AF|nr:serine hydrolase [Thermodesulfomicrobium sp. WS]